MLSAWGDGHLIRTVSRWPVVVDGFGDDVSPSNFAQAAAYFASESEREGLEILDSLRVRYVFARSVGSGQPSSNSASSMASRLFLTYAAEPALAHHRLVYASEELQGWRVRGDTIARPWLQVYEIVPAARFGGLAAAGSRIEVELAVELSSGESFVYRASVRADDSGHYELALPYATGHDASGVRTAQAYRVRIGGSEFPLVVSEHDVRSGARLEAPDS